ncbi:DNA-binding NtrC family response regulator [Lachnospiraceae bacterium PF1-22]|uniref:PrpR N-terminal domain-containing protein n=1 Tax=Ohessyouella blattaphilus TaxID=2949333 RepID=UPI003E19C5A1
MRKIKVLGIAPYDGLKLLMEQLSSNFPDIALTAVNGNLEEGKQIAFAMASEYDVIISRANTADLISNITPQPVVDIGISHYDILRCIKQADATKTPFAIIGFPGLTSIAKSLCELMEYNIPIIPMRSSDDITKILKGVLKEGYSTIICDTVPYPYAKKMGFDPILLSSGEASVNTAFANAIKQFQKSEQQRSYFQMMSNIINISGDFLFASSYDGIMLYQANAVPDSLKLISDIQARMKNSHKDTTSFFTTTNGAMYAVKCQRINDVLTPYYVCQTTKTDIPLTLSKNGVSVLTQEQALENFQNSFYHTTKQVRALQEEVDVLNQTAPPVMITGELGTGKDRIAQLIYGKSEMAIHPLFVINCSLLNEKSWSYLISNYNSPLMDNDNTIYFSNLHSLSDEKQMHLLSIFHDTNLHNRNRILLSYATEPEQKAPHMVMRFINMLHCYLIKTKSLREIIDSLETSANLYLDNLNQQTGRQVTSFSPESIKLLKAYDWPLNFVQFKRVLKNAIISTTELYVTPETIQKILDRERKITSCHHKAIANPCSNTESAVSSLDLSQPLHLINKDIITYILEKHNGNQSATARQLGISRTTLWRYLNS